MPVSIWTKAMGELAAEVTEPGDEELIGQAQCDRVLFTAIYQRYVTQVYLYCHIRLGSREAAEDATSEVFLKALAGLDSFRGGAVAAWLFRIAHNVVIDAYRKRHPAATMEEAEMLTDPTPSAEEQLIDEDTHEDIRAAIEMLPADQRTVLELQFSGWSGAQIAEALSRSPGAVRMLRLRAVERLREIIANDG